MKIQINDIYSIESEPLNFVIKKRYKTKKGKIEQRSVGHFPELSQAIRRVIQLDLMEDDLSGVQAVMNRVDALNAVINDLFPVLLKDLK